MHGQSALILATLCVIAAFVPIVVVARWLEARGRFGDPDRRVAFRSYGPVIAGALSLGTAAIHVSVIQAHAQAAAPAADPVLFLCAIGVATAHPAVIDTKLLGFLPLGVASLVVAPLQGVWAVPRLWRRDRGAVLGTVVSIGALGVTATQLAMQPLLIGPGIAVTQIGEVGTLSLIGEGLLLVAIATLVVGRPRRVVAALAARPIDAFVATTLAVVGVVIVTGVALLLGHGAH
jgi:hypothetical protein